MNQEKTPDSLDINFKAEAWKYTPRKAFDMKDFIVRDSDNKNYSWGMGPSEDQFQPISFNELIQDDSVIAHSPVKLPNSKGVERALLDKTLDKHLASEKEESILIKKTLNTNAWLNLNMTPSKFSMTIDSSTRQAFCLFESSQSHGLSQKMNVHLKSGSELDLGLHLSSDHKSYRQFNFVVEKDAKLNLFSLLSGDSTYKRIEIRVFLIDQNTSVFVNGLSLAKNNSVFDFHSDILHLEKNQETTQMYRSINQDKGHSIFSGRVHLTENSSGAQVEQLNNNLLLSEKSKVDTQPELNIYQDDVKASHGATTGSLDEDHFFYFRSRGFKLEQAKKMLLEGFCIEPLNCIKNPGLKAYFKKRITKEL
jgi:Fe-S cluster assembly scaffold protein SufB